MDVVAAACHLHFRLAAADNNSACLVTDLHRQSIGVAGQLAAAAAAVSSQCVVEFLRPLDDVPFAWDLLQPPLQVQLFPLDVVVRRELSRPRVCVSASAA